jgi:hypothetical protein
MIRMQHGFSPAQTHSVNAAMSDVRMSKDAVSDYDMIIHPPKT